MYNRKVLQPFRSPAIEENVLTAVKKLKDLRRIMSITIVMIMSDAGSTPEAFLNV